jgi:hypothetical protein
MISPKGVVSYEFGDPDEPPIVLDLGSDILTPLKTVIY